MMLTTHGMGATATSHGECRICTSASPPGLRPSSRFVGEGDHRAKNLMLIQRNKGFRQVRAVESVTPYVLRFGLY
jgi:hypothetical protein